MAAPRSASKPDDDQNAWVRSQYWLVNYSLGFGKKEWDAVVIHPSVAEPGKADPERDDLVRKLVAAHDLSLIDRKEGDDREAGEILREWLEKQAKENSAK